VYVSIAAHLVLQEHCMILVNASIHASQVLEDRVNRRRDLHNELDSMNNELFLLFQSMRKVRGIAWACCGHTHDSGH